MKNNKLRLLARKSQPLNKYKKELSVDSEKGQIVLSWKIKL